MKKLSELLRIVSKYHCAFFGDSQCTFMCGAADLAQEEGKITGKERMLVQEFCMELVDCIDENMCFLRSALREKDLPHHDDAVFLIYSAVIDKLESEGK